MAVFYLNKPIIIYIYISFAVPYMSDSFQIHIMWYNLKEFEVMATFTAVEGYLPWRLEYTIPNSTHAKKNTTLLPASSFIKKKTL